MSQMQQPGLDRPHTQSRQQSIGGPPRGQFFPTQNTLPQEVRAPTIARLDRILADATVLMTQAKYAHWNVKGMEFYGLHQLFDEIADTFEDHVDLIAERITALGGQAMGTTAMAAETTTVTRVPVEATGAAELVEILATRLATHDANLHGDIQAATSNDDPDTADLLNEISREVSQYLWFLEAHLQHGSGAPLPTTGSMSQSTNQSIGGQRGGRPPAQPQPQHSPQTQY